MGRKKIVDAKDVKSKVDLSAYDIVTVNYPFEAKLVMLFYYEPDGNIDDCIIEFEKKYGSISGRIYHNIPNRLVGFTGLNVIPRNERLMLYESGD